MNLLVELDFNSLFCVDFRPLDLEYVVIIISFGFCLIILGDQTRGV